jgi:DNA-binding MarR family transcriptional regulator
VQGPKPFPHSENRADGEVVEVKVRGPAEAKPEADVLAIADRLHSTAIHLLRRLRKQDIATGEGPARLSALSVLVFGGPKTLGELAAAEQVKPPTMSRMVAGLARSRLIEITADSRDARRKRIRATAKGARLLQKGRQLRIAYLASHLDRLDAEELSKLGEAVEILKRLLEGWL